MPNYLSPYNMGFATQPATRGASGTTPVPAPQTGNGPFGQVPGPITIPNPSADLSSALPGLSGLNSSISSDIYDKLNGFLSPSTLNAIQNKFGGEFGIRSGMPGSQLGWNNVYGNIIGASENQRQQGIQDYNATIPTVSGTQTVSPALQTQIQEQNAVNAAAPNPAAAATYAQQLFNQYLSMMRGPAGGTRGFGGNPAGGFQPFGSAPSTGSQALGFGFGSLGPMSNGTSGTGGDFTTSSGDFNSGFDPTQDLANWGTDLSSSFSDPSMSSDYQDFLDFGF